MTGIFNRRLVLRTLAGGLAMPAIITGARAAQPIDAALDFGVQIGTQDDQSEKVQAALDAASADGRSLLLPGGGRIVVHDLNFPFFTHLIGQGWAALASVTNAPVGRATSVGHITFENMGFGGSVTDVRDDDGGLLEFKSCSRVSLSGCAFVFCGANGILVTDSEVAIVNCQFGEIGKAAIHAADSGGLTIQGNRIALCGEAGIRIWRNHPGADGSIISGNRIFSIGSTGGNGENGNGVSIYKADDVIVSDNVIEDCAFSAVRVNEGKNTQIRGNTCIKSGEVAIFSEFGFSGSVIADNIIDTAATGISITNLDSGGHLATCTGNIVRNITPKSATNPDTRPVGIYAEADTVVANNTIDTVPGYGIVAGYGPFVRNIIVTGNVLTNVETGIGVSVVQEQAPGPVRVSGNLIGKGAAHGVVGLEWEKVVSDDLARDAANYPNVTVSDNTVG